MTLPVRLLVGNQDLSNVDGLKLVITETTPGGFDTCTFEVPLSLVPRLDDMIVVWDETYGLAAYLGVVGTVRIRGACAFITGVRPTQDKRFKDNRDINHSGYVFRAGERVIDIITETLGQLCPDVYQGTVVDYGIQIVDDTQDFSGHTFEDVANYMTSLTTQFSEPMLWWVRAQGQLMILDVNVLDEAPRYRVKVPLDQLEVVYERSAHINTVTVEWGNKQYFTVPENGVLDHTVLRQERDKFVNVSNSLKTWQQIQALCYNYYGRFSPLRSTQGQVTIKTGADAVRNLLVSPPNDNYPAWLLHTGYSIDVNMDGVPVPYNQSIKVIVGKSYDFDAGECVLSFGEIVNLDSQIVLVPSFFTDRLYNAAFQAPYNPKWAETDIVAKYGPGFDGLAPSNVEPGIPMFLKDNRNENQSEQTKYGGWQDPDTLADEGLEANFAFDVSSIGFKGGTYVIPGSYDNIKLTLFDDNGLKADTITFEVYTKRPNAALALAHPAITIPNVSERTVQLTTPILVPDRSTMIVFKVTVAATTAMIATGALHAKKYFPRIGKVQQNTK